MHSNGGNILEALQIGEFIRLRGWGTFSVAECYSSCALIWLAGIPRMTTPTDKIGFHAASLDGVEKGMGNAVVGAYLTRLGMSYKFIAWATSTPPSDIAILTPAKAKEFDIDVAMIGGGDNPKVATAPTAPVSPPSLKVPQASRPPSPSSTSTRLNLHMRVAPDPRAADALDEGAMIPKGSALSVVLSRCTVWMGSGRGSQDADNVWCPTNWGDRSGWVNAYYLDDYGPPLA